MQSTKSDPEDKIAAMRIAQIDLDPSNEIAWAARSPIPFQFLSGKLPIFSKSKRRD